jgi:GNAT superfamily N-acetyltransferase
MVPLDPAAARHVRARLGLPEGPGLLALRHALAYRRPGLWGDDPAAPRSVLLTREGDGRIEAFGVGEPWPALAWLVGHGRPFVLHAPDDWLATAVDALGGGVERVEVETWSAEGDTAVDAADEGEDAGGAVRGAPPRVAVRRLDAGDHAAFVAAAPTWALRGWQSYDALIELGVAYGTPHGSGFASLAWVFDQADVYDAVGVYTAPRFRRLGLGRATASALVEHVRDRRGKIPLWSFSYDNQASRALAASLGFTPAAVESVLYHPPRTEQGTGVGDSEAAADSP